jgi:hypothetical protein
MINYIYYQYITDYPRNGTHHAVNYSILPMDGFSGRKKPKFMNLTLLQFFSSQVDAIPGLGLRGFPEIR